MTLLEWAEAELRDLDRRLEEAHSERMIARLNERRATVREVLMRLELAGRVRRVA